MKITDIAPQAKQEGRYNIYVDNKYSFALSQLTLADSGLRTGQTLTLKDLNNLKKIATEDKLQSMALKLVSARPKSKNELELYLKRKGADHKLTGSIVNKLTKLGLIDDRKYAEMLVSHYRSSGQASRRKIIYKLHQKQIPKEDIDAALNNYPEDEVAVIKKIVLAKKKQTRYQDELKLKQYLIRQGFNYNDISEALK